MATVEKRVDALEAAVAALQVKATAIAAAAKALSQALAPTLDIAHQQDREAYPNGLSSILAAQKAALDAAATAFDALD